MTDRAHVLARQAMLEDSAMHFRYAGASGFGMSDEAQAGGDEDLVRRRFWTKARRVAASPATSGTVRHCALRRMRAERSSRVVRTAS